MTTAQELRLFDYLIVQLNSLVAVINLSYETTMLGQSHFVVKNTGEIEYVPLERIALR